VGAVAEARLRTAAALAALALLGLVAPRARADAWFESGRAAVERSRQLAPSRERARNLILFLGDGMGVSTVTAARILEGQLRGEPGEENSLSFERLPQLALVKTYNTDQQTADSAGTMTAIVTGSKTRAGVLGIDERAARGDHTAVAGHRLVSLFQLAEERGLATGVVTTTRVTHATPAACFAHAPEREWESDLDLPEAARAAGFPDIARQLVEFPHGDGLDVALGGGRAAFVPASAEAGGAPGRRLDGRDLAAEWQARGPESASVTSRAELLALDPARTRHVLGLFSPSHMLFDADRATTPNDEPSLDEMTRVALDVLERNPRGYVLMVEGGRIDHAHHLGNAYRALTDTIAFARTIGETLARVDLDETLVLVTADHSHVFTLAGYPTRGNPILGKVRGNDEHGEPADGLTLDVLGLPYTTLGYHNGAGYVGVIEADDYHDGKLTPSAPPFVRGRPDLTNIDTADPNYIQEAAIPTGAETHAGEDVAVYAGGPGARLVHGVMEQHELFHVAVEALGWNRPAPWWRRLFH
jgi:alkaline phosphatase